MFSDPVGAKLGVFSDAQAQGYSVVLTFIGISGPERSDERAEQGQGWLRWGSPPPPEHCTSRYAPAGVARAARKRVYCERKCST